MILVSYIVLLSHPSRALFISLQLGWCVVARNYGQIEDVPGIPLQLDPLLRESNPAFCRARRSNRPRFEVVLSGAIGPYISLCVKKENFLGIAK